MKGRTGDDMSSLQVIEGDDHTDDADPADGVVQVEPDAVALEVGAVVQGGVDVAGGEAGPAAVGGGVREEVPAVVGLGGCGLGAGHRAGVGGVCMAGLVRCGRGETGVAPAYGGAARVAGVRRHARCRGPGRTYSRG